MPILPAKAAALEIGKLILSFVTKGATAAVPSIRPGEGAPPDSTDVGMRSAPSLSYAGGGGARNQQFNIQIQAGFGSRGEALAMARTLRAFLAEAG
jgi:hypothetical protein